MQKHEIKITTRDRLMMAWHISMELVRNYETYAHEIENNDKVAKIFAEFAENEGMQASKFRELLHEIED